MIKTKIKRRYKKMKNKKAYNIEWNFDPSWQAVIGKFEGYITVLDVLTNPEYYFFDKKFKFKKSTDYRKFVDFVNNHKIPATHLFEYEIIES